MPKTDNPSMSLMSVDEALHRLLDQVSLTARVQTITLIKAQSRVVAQDVVAPYSVPPWDNSAVDGYAVNCQAWDPDLPLPVSQRIPAGVSPEPLLERTAARIFTGAPIPKYADAVVMQEDCDIDDERIIIRKPVSLRDNIRQQGQDIGEGDRIMQAGARLAPADIGVLASVGVDHINVYEPLTVAIVSTGNELIEPGHSLAPGTIYNSNRYLLTALLEAFGFRVVDVGLVPDEVSAVRRALLAAADQADAIITTGGVSVGEEDHVRGVVSELGRITGWRLAIKPGKPFAFGCVGQTPFFGLPGNPGAVWVTFLVLVRSALLAMQGLYPLTVPTFTAKADFSLTKPGKRQEYLRARLDRSRSAGLRVIVYPNQSSGVLFSASWADGLAVVPVGKTIDRGDDVTFISYSDLFV